MKDCKSCGMNYDQKEFEFCPYCGQVEEKVETERLEKAKVKKSKGKAPIKADQKKTVSGNNENKSAIEDKTIAAAAVKRQVLSRPYYLVIGIIALVLVGGIVLAISIFSDPGATVPNKYATIQEAIDAAADGDEIVVQAGIYRENIDFKGKNITLRSMDPADLSVVSDTIIDGGGSGIVVSFRSGEGEGAVLSGFTITRGSGIVISGDSSPIIENCIIENNNAEYGAGIYIVNSSPLIRNNTIINNIGFLGGGILMEESSPRIAGNTISGNRATNGSGIAILNNASPILDENLITDNYSENIGGGILVADGSKPLIQNNIISDNMAERNGGGLFVDESELIFENNMILRNQSANGGAIFIVNCMDGEILFSSNSFEDNFAFIAGGAIYIQGSSPIIEDNIFTQNESEHLGGATAVYLSSPVFLRNIFESNRASDFGRGGAIWLSVDSVLVMGEPDENTFVLNVPDDIFTER